MKILKSSLLTLSNVAKFNFADNRQGEETLFSNHHSAIECPVFGIILNCSINLFHHRAYILLVNYSKLSFLNKIITKLATI